MKSHFLIRCAQGCLGALFVAVFTASSAWAQTTPPVIDAYNVVKTDNSRPTPTDLRFPESDLPNNPDDDDNVWSDVITAHGLTATQIGTNEPPMVGTFISLDYGTRTDGSEDGPILTAGHVWQWQRRQGSGAWEDITRSSPASPAPPGPYAEICSATDSSICANDPEYYGPESGERSSVDLVSTYEPIGEDIGYQLRAYAWPAAGSDPDNYNAATYVVSPTPAVVDPGAGDMDRPLFAGFDGDVDLHSVTKADGTQPRNSELTLDQSEDWEDAIMLKALTSLEIGLTNPPTVGVVISVDYDSGNGEVSNGWAWERCHLSQDCRNSDNWARVVRTGESENLGADSEDDRNIENVSTYIPSIDDIGYFLRGYAISSVEPYSMRPIAERSASTPPVVAGAAAITAPQTTAVAHAANAAISQVTDVIHSRLVGAPHALSRAPDAGGSVTLGGKTFGWRAGRVTNASFLTDAVQTLCGTRGMQDGQRQACELRSFGDLLSGGAFEYASGPFGDLRSLGLWGQSSSGGFAGKLKQGAGAGSSYEGSLSSRHFGVDVDRGEGVLFGLALSSVDGSVDLDAPEADTQQMDISLRGVTPYMRWRKEDKHVWAMAGLSSGDVEVEGSEKTDLESRMLAAGMNKRYAGDIVQMTWKSDAHYSDIDGESELNSSSWRVRQAADFDLSRLLSDNKLKQHIEIGARVDGGDLQNALSRKSIGGGADLAFGLTYHGEVEMRVRAKTLIWHTNDDMQETGLSLRIARTAEHSRGLQFSLQPEWGDAAGGSEMWNHDTRALQDAADSDAEGFGWSPRVVAMKLGYGFDAPGANALVTPIVEWSQNGAREHNTKLGVSWQSSFKSLDKLRLDMLMESSQIKLKGRLGF